MALKLVNGVMMPDDSPPKVPKTASGKAYTEVRLRQFYTNDDNGMVVMPTVVYFFTDGEVDKDMEVGGLAKKLAADIAEQIPFSIRNLKEEEIAEELAKEIVVGSGVVSQGKAALAVFAKNIPDAEKPDAAPTKVETPPAANDNEKK